MSRKDMGRAAEIRRESDIAGWDEQTDVVVVGFGGAGACAALEARDAGADVLLLERTSGGGGTTGHGGTCGERRRLGIRVRVGMAADCAPYAACGQGRCRLARALQRAPGAARESGDLAALFSSVH